MTHIKWAESPINAGLFVINADKPALFFALYKKILTTCFGSLTILIENRKTPQLLREHNDITEYYLPKTHKCTICIVSWN